MSAAATPPKAVLDPDKLARARPLWPWLKAFVASTVGAKILIALTGLGLVGFVIAHMLGNSQIFLGRYALNDYAKSLEDMGPLLWAGRLGLLAIFVLHLVLALRLKRLSLAARPVPYAYGRRSAQADWASTHMALTGLVVLAFLAFHLAHYTFGWVGSAPGGENLRALKDPRGLRDAYAMTYYGFRNVPVSVLYVVAQVVLALHLTHGTKSLFQTLGLNNARLNPVIYALSVLVTAVVVGVNIAIPVAVMAGYVPAP